MLFFCSKLLNPSASDSRGTPQLGPDASQVLKAPQPHLPSASHSCAMAPPLLRAPPPGRPGSSPRRVAPGTTLACAGGGRGLWGRYLGWTAC